jgi:uncharacterized membrane protein HdeD (DUF308 family)
MQAFPDARGGPAFCGRCFLVSSPLAVGMSLLLNPTAGALSLTIVVAVLFLVVGVVKIMYCIFAAARSPAGDLIALSGVDLDRCSAS